MDCNSLGGVLFGVIVAAVVYLNDRISAKNRENMRQTKKLIDDHEKRCPPLVPKQTTLAPNAHPFPVKTDPNNPGKTTG